MIRRVRRHLAAPLLALLVGWAALGCGSDDEGRPAPTPDTTTAGDAAGLAGTTTPHPEATAPDTAPDTAPGTAPDGTPEGPWVLATDGIGPYRLGSDQVEVLDGMFAVLGPASDVGPIECPGGSDTTATWPSVGLVFVDGFLSGWSWGREGQPPPPIAAQTPEGITVGSTVGDLEAAYGDGLRWIPESTLGTEFYVGSGFPGFGGFATGTDAADTVTMLYSGDLCAYR